MSGQLLAAKQFDKKLNSNHQGLKPQLKMGSDRSAESLRHLKPESFRKL